MKESDGAWVGGLDDEGARELAVDLLRYFEAANALMPEKVEGISIASAWLSMLDSSEPSHAAAATLQERITQHSGGSAWHELQRGLAAWTRWRWGGPFEFEYKLTGSGWSEAYIGQAGQWLRPTASYLTDALRAFVSAVIAVLQGHERVACIWEEEPGEFLWLFERERDLVDLKVIWRSGWSAQPSDLDQWFTPPENVVGDLKLRLRSSPAAIGRGVLVALDRLLSDVGRTGYEQSWGKPFPEAQYQQLRRLVGKHD